MRVVSETVKGSTAGLRMRAHSSMALCVGVGVRLELGLGLGTGSGLGSGLGLRLYLRLHPRREEVLRQRGQQPGGSKALGEGRLVRVRVRGRVRGWG